MEGGVLKVSKGALVVMKDRKVGSLYILHGSTVTGISRHRIIVKTPQQNGVVERMNRTLLERAHCKISNAGLSKDFWAEVVSTACFMVNCSVSTSVAF